MKSMKSMKEERLIDLKSKKRFYAFYKIHSSFVLTPSCLRLRGEISFFANFACFVVSPPLLLHPLSFILYSPLASLASWRFGSSA